MYFLNELASVKKKVESSWEKYSVLYNSSKYVSYNYLRKW